MTVMRLFSSFSEQARTEDDDADQVANIEDDNASSIADTEHIAKNLSYVCRTYPSGSCGGSVVSAPGCYLNISGLNPTSPQPVADRHPRWVATC
jgi:hypothetical protein